MSPFTLGFLILAAVLVGAAVPVLLQLRATLRSVEVALNELRPQIKNSLLEVERAAAGLARTAAELEQGAAQAKAVVASVASFGKSVSRFGESLRGFQSIGGALAPAFAAGMRAFLG